MKILDKNKRLVSTMWFDQDNALSYLENRLDSGKINREEADNLKNFVEKGFVRFTPDWNDDLFNLIQSDINQLWQDKPANLAVAYNSGLESFADIDDGIAKHSNYRIADLHSHSDAVAQLYWNQDIFRYIELIFEETAIAIQSLYFEHGSQQKLHRDPTYVQTQPPGHLLASWIALEDIDENSGPLLYIPGSHRWPYFEFTPGEIVFDPLKHDKNNLDEMDKHLHEMCEQNKISPVKLTAKKGDVLIWHGSLCHGGDQVKDNTKTRKSFVIHYSTLNHYKLRQGELSVTYDGIQQKLNFSSAGKINKNNVWGMENPVIGYRKYNSGIKQFIHDRYLSLKSHLSYLKSRI